VLSADRPAADKQSVAIIEPFRFADNVVVLRGCEKVGGVGNAVVVVRLQCVKLAFKPGLGSLCVEEAEPEVAIESSEIAVPAESKTIRQIRPNFEAMALFCHV